MAYSIFIVGGRTYTLAERESSDPIRFNIDVSSRGVTWTFTQARGRALGFGEDSGCGWFWTAYGIVDLGMGSDPVYTAVDDDQLLHVYKVGNSWLAVGGASVRLLIDGAEAASFATSEVIVDSELHGRSLELTDLAGRTFLTDVGDASLSPIWE